MTEPTIAVIDPFHPRILAALEDALPPNWRLAVTAGPSPSEHASVMARADMAFVMATPMPRGLLEVAPKLRFIQKLGAGVDRIDQAYCAEAGIGLARLQAGNSIPVAEHALLLMLAACRNLPALDRQTRAGAWDKEDVRGRNLQLHGKTVGIVGFGAIGRQLARLLSGFEARLVYHDPLRASSSDEAAYGVRYLPLEELLETAEVVSLHLPLLPETAGIISAARLRRMRPGAVLVNAARGGLIDEPALAEALREGHLFAAGIDAFSQEPPVGNPLLELENTVVTPHCAGATIDNFAQVARRGVDNMRRVLAGEPLPPADQVVAPRARTGEAV